MRVCVGSCTLLPQMSSPKASFTHIVRQSFGHLSRAHFWSTTSTIRPAVFFQEIRKNLKVKQQIYVVSSSTSNAMQGLNPHSHPAHSLPMAQSQSIPTPPPPPSQSSTITSTNGTLPSSIGAHSPPEKDLRKTILPIFYELIAELQAGGADFKQIQSKLVDKLDAAVFEHQCDQEFKQLFCTLWVSQPQFSIAYSFSVLNQTLS